MIYLANQWKNPAVASVRLPVALDSDGNIGTFDATTAGEKALTFSTVSVTTTPDDLGTFYAGDDTPGTLTGGIAGVFVEYLLGAEYNILAAKRTITQTVEEVA